MARLYHPSSGHLNKEEQAYRQKMLKEVNLDNLYGASEIKDNVDWFNMGRWGDALKQTFNDAGLFLDHDQRMAKYKRVGEEVIRQSKKDPLMSYLWNREGTQEFSQIPYTVDWLEDKASAMNKNVGGLLGTIDRQNRESHAPLRWK